MSEYISPSIGTTSDPKEIIKELRVRPNLRSLSLNHSGLGDEQSKVLFQWLAYGDNDSDIYDDKENCLSLPLPLLTNISLTGASIGNKGFGALVEWLERLKKRQQANISNPPSKIPDGIRELSLNSNCISGTSDLALSFVSALSFHKTEPPYLCSSLSYLNLSSNRLSYEFKQELFSSLASVSSLRVLSLSMTGLNQADTDALAAYIGQCRLIELNASANNMGYTGLKKIVKAVKRCWTLEKVNVYANDIGNKGEGDDESGDDDAEESPMILPFVGHNFESFSVLEQKLKQKLSRNIHLKHEVQAQAFELLRCSRLFLLNRHSDHDQYRSEADLLAELVEREPPHHSNCTHSHKCECLPTFHIAHSRPPSPLPLHASTSYFPFARLPIEIQLNILSLLAPILSSSQQIRIFEHAVDKATLPDLSLRFPPSNFRATGGLTRPGNPAKIFGARYSARGGGSFGMMITSDTYEEMVDRRNASSTSSTSNRETDMVGPCWMRCLRPKSMKDKHHSRSTKIMRTIVM